MRLIVIHRNKENNSFRRAYFAPENQTISELESNISEYNADSEEQIVSFEDVPDELVQLIKFLIDNRDVSIGSNIEELRELRSDINDMRYSIDNAIERLEKRLEKEDEGSN